MRPYAQLTAALFPAHAGNRASRLSQALGLSFELLCVNGVQHVKSNFRKVRGLISATDAPCRAGDHGSYKLARHGQLLQRAALGVDGDLTAVLRAAQVAGGAVGHD